MPVHNCFDLDAGDTAFAADQEIAEYSGSGALLKRFVRLPGSIDETFLMIDVSGATAVETWAHANRQGSVVATTNSAGNVNATYRYSPFGRTGAEGNGGFPFRYTGQRLDAETGLHYYKARYYDPETGRFLQTDPIGYADQMNLYAYVGNDPFNHTDPSGLAGCSDMSEQGLSGDCIDASNYNPDSGPGDLVIGSPEHDQAAIGVAGSLRGRTEKGTTLDYSDEKERVVAGTSEEGKRTRAGQETKMEIKPNTEAIVHSHPETNDFSIAPGYQSPKKGDHIAVQRGYPNYITRDGKVIVLENSNGQLRVRSVEGTLTAGEQKQVRLVLRKMQRVIQQK